METKKETNHEEHNPIFDRTEIVESGWTDDEIEFLMDEVQKSFTRPIVSL